jgi:hypothetical protein
MFRLGVHRLLWTSIILAGPVLQISSRAEESGPIPQLKGLGALEGEWVAESKGAGGASENRSIRYRWINQGRCLEADSERRDREGVVQMRILYYWDAVSGTIRALTVGSDGSWAQSEVEIAAGTIRLNTHGGSPDGKTLSLVSILEPGPGESRIERWTKRVFNGAALDDATPIVWRKKPPSPPVSQDEMRSLRQDARLRYPKTASSGDIWTAHAMHGRLVLRELGAISRDVFAGILATRACRPAGRETRSGVI